jgi:superfamily II DNA/RNA helicase
MLQQDPPAIQLDSVEWLILDETDKLFEEGKDGFRDQVSRKIIKPCKQECSQPQTSGSPIVQLTEAWILRKCFYFRVCAIMLHVFHAF